MWRHRPGHVTDSSTEYSEQGYVVTYVDNDHYRFIVDPGECAGGMHLMEVQDDCIDAGQHRREKVIPPNAIEDMHREDSYRPPFVTRARPPLQIRGLTYQDMSF